MDDYIITWLFFAKTGWAISKITQPEEKIELVDCGLLISNKDLDVIERITQHINDIMRIYYKYSPDLTVKEGAIMGRSSTGLNVIKAHGALEYLFNDLILPLDDIHNATVKAFCRKLVNDKSIDKKKVVAKAIEIYYNRDIPEIYTERGRLLDDVSDAIAIGFVYFEKNLK